MRKLFIPICFTLIQVVVQAQNTGIGTTIPTHTLHIVALSNPLRIEGLQGGNDTDSIMTITSTGVVRRRSINTSGGGWSTTGNLTINPATNFLGTLSNTALVFRTNNVASGFIDPDNTRRNNAFGNGAIAGTIIIGNGNNAFGYQALRQVSFGIGNTAFGDSALFTNVAGSNNVAIGPNALEVNLGSENIGIGTNALVKNIGGTNNIAIGVAALINNTTALNNLAIGSEALRLSNANDNVAIGYRTGYALTTGQQNTLIGNFTMLANIAGGNNTYMGYQVAQSQTSGSANTFIGFLSGGNFLGGSNNTMLGSGADVLNINSTFSNSTALGSGAIIDRSNMVRLGNSTVTRLESAVSLTTPSDGRIKKNILDNIPGLSFIEKLRPVSYNYDLNMMNKIMGNKKMAVNAAAVLEKEQIRYSGFIAQEVYLSAKELGYDFSGVSAPANEKGLYGLAYAEMVVPLVKAVQELKALADKQQIEIEMLKLQLQVKK